MENEMTPVVVPETPFYFKIAGLGGHFWRLNREDGPLFTLNGATLVNALGVNASLRFEGPDLVVTHASFTAPGGGPSPLPAAARDAYAAEAREKLIACLASGAWTEIAGY
jgi:hypothetical protein